MSDETNWFATVTEDTGADGGGGESDAPAGSGEERAADGGAVAGAEAGTGSGAEGAKEGAGEGQGQPRTVPLSALQEERKLRQQERADRERLQTRFDQLLERFGGGAPAGGDGSGGAAPKKPTLEEDPYAVLKDLVQDRDQRAASEREATETRRVIGQLAAHTQQSEQAFKVANPDYEDAVGHLMTMRDRELQFHGVRDSQQRAAVLAQERLQFIVSCVQRGVDPAEQAYAYAQMRGYQRKAPAPAPAPAPTPGQRVEAAAKGAAASRAPGGGGAAPRGTLTASDIAKMSDEEFDKLDYGAFRRAAGG